MLHLSIRGSDRFLDGDGTMKWKLWGILPLMSASGSDISRSALGRLQGEAVWLPSALCRNQVAWVETGHNRVTARTAAYGQPADLDLILDDAGKLREVRMQRWGNPGGGGYRLVDFGVYADAERTFGGYTIPSRIRAGWFFGSGRFENESEFFRATIDEAAYL